MPSHMFLTAICRLNPQNIHIQRPSYREDRVTGATQLTDCPECLGCLDCRLHVRSGQHWSCLHHELMLPAHLKTKTSGIHLAQSSDLYDIIICWSSIQHAVALSYHISVLNHRGSVCESTKKKHISSGTCTPMYTKAISIGLKEQRSSAGLSKSQITTKVVASAVFTLGKVVDLLYDSALGATA